MSARTRRRVIWAQAVLLTLVAGVMALATLGGGQEATGSATSGVSNSTSASVVRIGTVSRMDLLVLYTKSSIHAANIQALRRQLDEAKAKGDTKRAKEIEKQGGELQEQRHRQLAAEEGLDNIIKDTEHIWNEIAAEAGVQAIVIDAVMFKGKGVEVVDVTPLLEKRLKN